MKYGNFTWEDCTVPTKDGKKNIDVSLITDEDNIYYLCHIYDYLHMEFGGPTILVASVVLNTLLITPEIDFNTAKVSTRVDAIAP